MHSVGKCMSHFMPVYIAQKEKTTKICVYAMRQHEYWIYTTNNLTESHCAFDVYRKPSKPHPSDIKFNSGTERGSGLKIYDSSNSMISIIKEPIGFILLWLDWILI